MKRQLLLEISLLLVVITLTSTQAPNCAQPPPQILPETCCAIPRFFDDADLIKCKNAARTKRFATSRIELGTCYLDCVFESTGVTINGGRVLNTNTLLRILSKDTPSEPQTLQVISTSVTECINELNSGVMKIRTPTLYNCSTIPSAIMSCIHRKFFFSCPQNRFQATPQCFQLRDFMQRCAVNI